MEIEFTVNGARNVVSMDANEFGSDDLILGALNAALSNVPFETWHSEELTIDNLYRLQQFIGALTPDRRPKIFRVLFRDAQNVSPATRDYIRKVFEGL